MNASYDWLRALVPITLSPAAVRDLITARCCPVDELVSLRHDLQGIVVGQVLEARRHPDSDHLWVVKVDAGSGTPLDVVCGAPNVREGARYPFAPVGVTLPGGLTLERRRIRGAISNGMLCSARELGLGDDHTGILELDTGAAPGTPFQEVVPIGDWRLVVDVTPNRPDLLSHLGLAREIAAATGAPLALPAIPGSAGAPHLAITTAARTAPAGAIRVVLDDAAGCPRYAGVVLRGVTVGPSPAWLAERLAAVGARPINNVVDVTNYLLFELGQPMHAFDAGRLRGSTIVIRRARPGEPLVTLDGAPRVLSESMTVIADGDGAQAVAGVMGGAGSEVGPSTTDLFLEVAHFDPAAVRRTRRALGLSTDASYRFERGTDPDLPPRALARAVEMLLAVAGGRVDGSAVDIHAAPIGARQAITLRVDRAGRVLGVPVTPGEIADLLTPIGFGTSGAGAILDVTPPTWRPDVAGEVDLIEEIARLRGYDSFPGEVRPVRPGTVPDSDLVAISRRLRELLVARGLLEARPLPFVRGGRGYVRMRNPLSDAESYLRRDLLETLARAAEHNLAHMQRDIRLFEIGAVFGVDAAPLPREAVHVAALVSGHRRPPHWTEPRPPDFDEWDAKGLAEELARTLHAGASVALESAEPPDIWRVLVDGVARGRVTRLELDAPVWAAPVFGVELLVQETSAEPVAPPGSARHAEPRPRAVDVVPYRAIPVTPAAEFDLALLVPEGMRAATVEAAIRAAAGELLERLVLFDEFRGGTVPPGHRSVAWRLTFRHPERTLRDREIAGRREMLLRTLEEQLGVRQRAT